MIMTKQEFAVFAAALRTYYPRETLLPNQQAMELWYRELQDIPYAVAEAGLRQWVATNKWSPSIADIRAMTSEVAHGEIADWGDGWGKVLKAISQYGSYRESEALNSLDELTRTCVQRLGFRNICMSENIETDRANFRMMYEQMAEKKKRQQQTPIPLQRLISGLQGQGLLEGDKKDVH